MQTLAETLELQPDFHFWHQFTYADNHRNWVQTGDPAYLASMLECIAYAPHTPDPIVVRNNFAGWDQADNWRDTETFGSAYQTFRVRELPAR
jgi:hypothetical protein